MNPPIARIVTGWESVRPARPQTGNLTTGLAELDLLSVDEVTAYQAFWMAQGHLLELLQRRAEAKEAWEFAIQLTKEPALREYLWKRVQANG